MSEMPEFARRAYHNSMEKACLLRIEWYFFHFIFFAEHAYVFFRMNNTRVAIKT